MEIPGETMEFLKISIFSRRLFGHALGLIAIILLGLSPAPAQNFKVVLLGTGNPEPDMRQFGPSTLVQVAGQNLLFDCGRGATLHLSALGLSLAQINELFITHLHSDHITGIPDLYLTGWLLGRKTPFRVLGPAGTVQMMEHLKQAYRFDIGIREKIDLFPASGAALDVKDIQQGVVFESGGVKVTAFLVHHGEVKPAFGYRVDYAGHSATISGDTGFSDNLIRYARGTDVLVINVIDPAAFRAQVKFLSDAQFHRIIPLHTTPQQAGEIFTRAKVRLGVYTHLIPRATPDLIPETRKTYSGPLVVGKDMTEIDIGRQIRIHGAWEVGLSSMGGKRE